MSLLHLSKVYEEHFPICLFSHLSNWQHNEVNVGEVAGQPEVAPPPLGHGGLVEVGEGQLVAEVSHQLRP